MTTEEIRAELATIVNDVTGKDPAEVTLERAFAADLGVDSLEMMDILYEAEDRFSQLGGTKVEIPDTESKNLVTVGDAVAFIAAQL